MSSSNPICFGRDPAFALRVEPLRVSPLTRFNPA
jgi:hypothetical protein